MKQIEMDASTSITTAHRALQMDCVRIEWKSIKALPFLYGIQ